jgi:hypothetical protein
MASNTLEIGCSSIIHKADKPPTAEYVYQFPFWANCHSHCNRERGLATCRIYVGDSRKEFLVHRGIIPDTIINACPSITREGGVLFLWEHGRNEDSYALLIDWLYFRSVPSVEASNPWTKKKGDAAEKSIMNLLDLLILAEGYGLHLLMNQTMEAIVLSYRNLNCYPKTETIVHCFKKTVKESPLRLFMSRYMTYIMSRTTGTNHPTGGPSNKELNKAMRDCDDLSDTVREQIRGFSRGRHHPIDDPTTSPLCSYYVKEDLSPVCSEHRQHLEEYDNGYDRSSRNARRNAICYHSSEEED